MKVEEGVDGESATDKYSRDFLQSSSLCTGGGGVAEKSSHKLPNKETEELELGLSLGGKFGIEKSTTPLVRSASVVAALHVTREEDLGSISRLLGSFPSIIRTSSLRTEADEEFRERKEWQSLQHLEAKRRRCEKQRKLGEKDCGDEIKGRSTRNFVKHWGLGNERVPGAAVMPLPFGMPSSPTIAGHGPIGVAGVGEVGNKAKEGILGVGSYGLVGFGLASAHGSMEAQRGNYLGSGGGSDSDGRPTQGSSTRNETKSPATNGLSPGLVSPAKKPPMETPREGIRDILPCRDAPEIKPKVQGASLTEDSMPCVFTKGEGPNGKRVDGILDKYRKGEEVRIMCICHRKFLSPAEFVRHAGGETSAFPMTTKTRRVTEVTRERKRAIAGACATRVTTVAHPARRAQFRIGG